MRHRSLICVYNRPRKLGGTKRFSCTIFLDYRNKLGYRNKTVTLHETWGSAGGIRG